jgi:hypothetical protein
VEMTCVQCRVCDEASDAAVTTDTRRRISGAF